jgi:hypothetical protein
MIAIFLLPGDFVCDLLKVPAQSDHRQILRSFFNMLVWGAVSIATVLTIAL